MTTVALPRRRASGAALPSAAPGVAITYLSVIVLLPLAALLWQSQKGGAGAFWKAVSAPDAVAALELTLGTALLVALINAVFGTLIAWVLVRDSFRGKGMVNSLIDLPFALPTVVAGLTLLTLYGPYSPIGLNITYTRKAVVLALLFETLPFVIRSVQPVLLELDREMEEAAASLGARGHVIFRRVVLPNLLPAILSGMALAFARAVGEYGSVVMLSGNVPFSTEVASVHIYSQIQSDYVTGATAMSIVLLVISLVVLLSISALHRWSAKHDR
jgi:sulfate/thiosulfate transport system permease protein